MKVGHPDSLPTASQADVDVQLTDAKLVLNARALERCWIHDRPPLSERPIVALEPMLEFHEPTTSQVIGEGHETPLTPAIQGASCEAVHKPPPLCVTRGAEIRVAPCLDSTPPATQVLVEPQEMAIGSPCSATDCSDHIEPPSAVRRMRGVLNPPVEPTDQQLEEETHVTAFNSPERCGSASFTQEAPPSLVPSTAMMECFGLGTA
jgi:hypothetical protein